ncbi:unnamed protein product [Paramecium pentaurelia]|uniref:Uncharacterized protein n=1 Tax=Paramecium pentaurelia TaxID=43138 RepID=A0A8S1WJT7_9CILI|nr:unnamed protein product [Paramecium pentaurelia]
MEQLVSLLQKKQLQKEERLKSLIKIIDRRIVQKLYNLRNYAFFKIKNFKIANRNNVKLISEKDDEKGTFQINISNTNQFREALYQLQNYNLVQLEILKKETLCRMVYILQKRVNHHYRHLLIKVINKKSRNIIPFLKVFTYRFNYQSRFLKILQKFQRNREIQLQKEMKKQEAISKFVMSLENKKLHCFCQWKKKFQINQNEQSYIDSKRQNEFIQLTFQIVAFLTKQKFKILSNAFVDLKKNKQRNAQKIVIMFNLKILFRRLILKNLSFAFYKIVCYNRNNQGSQCANVDIIKNLSVISSKLNQGLNQAHMKYQRKRRNLIIYKYLSKINMNENQMISKYLTKWKRILNQFNFQMRIKIIQQSKELEEDQQLLVQQYKQLSIENSELQQMYQQVQTYFHTPTGLSVKKSETKQNQQIIQGQQQQAFQLQSQQQEAFWDEDLMQSEDYSPEFVENIENQNVELKYKIEEQQAKRNMYLEEFQSRKQELLQQIALKKQIQKVQ